MHSLQLSKSIPEETLAQRRWIARTCARLKAYTGEWAWKAIGNGLQSACFLSRVDHDMKTRSRKQRTDVRKYSFADSAIQSWNQLPADTLWTLL
jgi:hypothetical protein